MARALRVDSALPRTQAVILTSFLGFQVLDALTTHLGLTRRREELNQLMGAILSDHGELATFAIKGIVIATLLAVLMLLQRRRPRIWYAFVFGSWLSAGAVFVNLYQLAR